MLYVLTTDKKVYEETARKTRDECWQVSWPIVVEKMGADWGSKYWKRWDASIKAAKKAGFIIERAKLVMVL